MSHPAYTSGANHMETRVYITDRNNERRDLIEATEIEVNPDWDIDRAGSKGQVDVTASRGVLEPGMWIAPYQVIIPETGNIVEQQKGHFRLGRPGSMFDDTVGDDGNHRQVQNAFGSDIVDDIAAVKLPESFYTPVGGNVMRDVHVLIKMATAGIFTPIPIANPSFEADPLWSGWTTGFSAGAVGAFTIAPGSGAVLIPDGKRAFGMTMDTRPVGGYGYAWQIVPLSAGAQRLMLTGLHIPYNFAYRGMANLQFRDASSNVISTVTSRVEPDRAVQWYRAVVVAEVPPGTVSVRVYVESRIVAAGAPWARPMWDDIRLYSMSNEPLPDSRINLPPSVASATTRIQSTVGDSIGYNAINADRLAAIGHHALYAEQRGLLTSLPLRDTNTATPVRTYRRTDIRDYRIIGPVEMPASDGNVPNHFMAVKESFEEGVATMYANAYNDNPNDAFSTVNTGRVISDDPIMVQDAVDQAALQAVADSARDRQSAQEELHIWVLPDATLNVHDVVEIDDATMPGVSGKWLVQYLRPGMRPDDPLMELGLRRALTGGT